MQSFIERITNPLPDSLQNESVVDPLSITNFDWSGIRFGEVVDPVLGGEIAGGATAVDAGAMFGSTSTLVTPTVAVGEQTAGVVDSTVYNAVVVLLFLGLCYLAYAFRGGVTELLKTTTRKINPDTYITENKSFKIFLQYMLALGTLTFGVLAIRWSGFEGEGGVLGAAAIPVLVGLYQIVALRIAGVVTLSKGFVDELLNIKIIVAALATLFVSPVVLLIATYSGVLFFPISYLIVAELVAAIVYGIVKTYSLFVRQRVPILNWFLYLCAVEIFPCSLLIIIIIAKST